MKLFYSPASPFARKVRIVAAELGLADQIEVAQISPWAEEGLRGYNPLSKIPALVLDDGVVLFDSRVICDYLNDLAKGALVPAAGRARALTLRMEALADGIGDAGVRRIVEERRPNGDGHADVIARQNLALQAALDLAEGEADDFGEAFDLGQIALAAALGYLDFRLAHEDWRPNRPLLAEWFAKASARPSFTSTEPT
jgi:glutathione S-transferase